jgi:hypothetical protein
LVGAWRRSASKALSKPHQTIGRFQVFTTIDCRKWLRFRRGILMRIANLRLIGSMALLAVVVGPALAKNAAPPPKAEDQSVSASCHSYQMAADGSWSVLPCHEAGQTEHRPPPKAGEQEPR